MFWYNVFITFSTEVCALQMEDLVPMQCEMKTYRKIKRIIDSVFSLWLRHMYYKAGTHTPTNT